MATWVKVYCARWLHVEPPSAVGYKEPLSALQKDNAKGMNIHLVVAEKKRKQEKFTAEGQDIEIKLKTF